MNIEHVTMVFLIAVFVAAEVLRIKRGSRGIIVSMRDGGLAAAVSVMSVKVRLKDGAEIEADLNPCTACMGRLKVGDEVRISPTRDGYVVDLPWIRRGDCQSDSGGCC
jgi:hypothetical protein